TKARPSDDIELRLLGCAQPVLSEAMKAARDGGLPALQSACRDVAEVRAGLRSAPAAASMTPLVRVLLTLTGETDAIVRDLAVQYGSEQARRIVYRPSGCGFGGGFGG